MLNFWNFAAIDNMLTYLQADFVSESFQGVYQCTAESDNVTIWSRELGVKFVPQPYFIVSPKVSEQWMILNPIFIDTNRKKPFLVFIISKSRLLLLSRA